MTRSLGKLDHEQRLMTDLQKASEAFKATCIDQSLVQTHGTVEDGFDAVSTDIKGWLLGTPNFNISGTSFPFDVAVTALIRVYASRFKKMEAFVPDKDMRVNVFFSGILSKN